MATSSKQNFNPLLHIPDKEAWGTLRPCLHMHIPVSLMPNPIGNLPEQIPLITSRRTKSPIIQNISLNPQEGESAAMKVSQNSGNTAFLHTLLAQWQSLSSCKGPRVAISHSSQYIDEIIWRLKRRFCVGIPSW